MEVLETFCSRATRALHRTVHALASVDAQICGLDRAALFFRKAIVVSPVCEVSSCNPSSAMLGALVYSQHLALDDV